MSNILRMEIMSDTISRCAVCEPGFKVVRGCNGLCIAQFLS